MSRIDPTALKRLRKASGLTQKELAERSKVPYSTLTKLEQGKIPHPSVASINDLAGALSCMVPDLLEAGDISIGQNPDIKFVYFDVGGVLVHWKPSLQAYAARINRPLDAVMKLFYEYNPAGSRGNMTLEEFQLLCILKLNLDVKGDGREAAMKSWVEDMRPILSAHKLANDISRRYPVGLLTNITKGYYPEFIARRLVPNLRYKAVVKSCDLGVIKPESEIFDIAAQAARIEPEQILFIDDTQTNVEAAKKLGWQAEWFDEYDPQSSIQRITRKYFSV